MKVASIFLLLLMFGLLGQTAAEHWSALEGAEASICCGNAADTCGEPTSEGSDSESDLCHPFDGCDFCFHIPSKEHKLVLAVKPLLTRVSGLYFQQDDRFFLQPDFPPPKLG